MVNTFAGYIPSIFNHLPTNLLDRCQNSVCQSDLSPEISFRTLAPQGCSSKALGPGWFKPRGILGDDVIRLAEIVQLVVILKGQCFLDSKKTEV